MRSPKILSLFLFATLSSVAAGQTICPTTPDFMNLNDSCVVCNYGWTNNPFAYTGIANTRHTLITTQGFVDPNTGNKLPLIPEGDNMSIQLGNSQIGAEAEAITYNFKVEPDKALLSIKFAVVFQDPGHQHDHQPRFMVRILNEFNELVEPCAEYDVSAAAGIPGFESYFGMGCPIRWRPWTTIALDLSDYINQNIKVQFVNYDCSELGHFGYAYFTAQCLPNKLELTACSNTSDTIELSAPPFCESYAWTNGDTSALSKFVIKAGNPVMASCLITSVTGCQFTLNAHVADGIPFTNDTVIYDTICEGEPYVKNYFDLPPQYKLGTSTHINSFYDKTTCSGTITVLLNLMVIQRYYHIEEAICYGEDYIKNGFAILKPAVGLVHDTLIFSNLQGCDSVLILRLTVTPAGLSLPKTILGNPMPCSGELEVYTLSDAEFFTNFDWTTSSDIFIGSIINTAKIALQFTDDAVADTLKLYARNGCDSVFLTLPVEPKRSYYSSFMDSICTGLAYNENDFNIPRQDSAGVNIFSQKYSTQDGCDSVRSLFLYTLQSPEVEIQSSKDVICEDDSVKLHVVSTSADFKVKKIKIGDILCTDESIVTKEDFPTSGKTAMGIVFWVSPDQTHGWAVSLTAISPAAWATVNGIIPGVTTLHLPAYNEFTWADTAGYQNTKAIRVTGDASLFPAAWAVDFDNGWFLPAATQIKILLGNAILLEPSYSVVGAPLVTAVLFESTATWSSTQFNSVGGDQALRLISDGYLQNNPKSLIWSIIQIRTFRIGN